MQIDKWMMVANHLDCHRGYMAFSANSMTSRHLKTQCSLSPWKKLSGHKFLNFDLEVPQIFSDFFAPSFRLVLPAAWPPAVAPEAKHRCTWQPTKGTIPWSSGSWRRRRPWMHRTNTAVASEEDIGGETS